MQPSDDNHSQLGEGGLIYSYFIGKCKKNKKGKGQDTKDRLNVWCAPEII